MISRITAQMVEELREASGASMVDCRHALRYCAGDFDQALRRLREKPDDNEPEAEEEPA